MNENKTVDKNEKMEIEDTYFEYISFGRGTKVLIMIPGLGESLTSFKGLAAPISIMYKMYAKEYKVYMYDQKRLVRYEQSRD